MAVSHTDIQAFSDFALRRVDNGGADSMQELLYQWLAAREAEEVADDVRQGHADIEAGRGKPAAEVFADIRKKLDSLK